MTNFTQRGNQQEQAKNDTDFLTLVSCDCPGGFYVGKTVERADGGIYCAHCGRRMTLLDSLGELKQLGGAHE